MTRPCVLITRPAEGAQVMAEMLSIRGFDALIEPMLQLQPLTPQAVSTLEQSITASLQGTIITSQHSLPALMPHKELRNLPLFVVGEATAREAKRLGFSQVTHGPDVYALLKRLVTSASPSNGPLLYARGQHVAYNLGVAMRHQGFEVEEAIVYRMRAATEFSPRLVSALAEHTLFAATFLSLRTAETFMQLVGNSPEASALSGIHAVAFSPQVAVPLASGIWKHVTVCEQPTLSCLLDNVDKLEQPR